MDDLVVLKRIATVKIFHGTNHMLGPKQQQIYSLEKRKIKRLLFLGLKANLKALKEL